MNKFINSITFDLLDVENEGQIKLEIIKEKIIPLYHKEFDSKDLDVLLLAIYHFCDENDNACLNKKEFERFMYICDEFTHLPNKVNSEILYGSILYRMADKNMSMNVSKDEIKKCIDKVELNPLMVQFKPNLIKTKEFYNQRKQKVLVKQFEFLEVICSKESINDFIQRKYQNAFINLFGQNNSNELSINDFVREISFVLNSTSCARDVFILSTNNMTIPMNYHLFGYLIEKLQQYHFPSTPSYFNRAQAIFSILDKSHCGELSENDIVPLFQFVILFDDQKESLMKSLEDKGHVSLKRFAKTMLYY